MSAREAYWCYDMGSNIIHMLVPQDGAQLHVVIRLQETRDNDKQLKRGADSLIYQGLQQHDPRVEAILAGIYESTLRRRHAYV